MKNSNRPKSWGRLEALGHQCSSEDNEKEINRGRHLFSNSRSEGAMQDKVTKIPDANWSDQVIEKHHVFSCSRTENDTEQYGPRLGKPVCLGG